MSSGDAPNFSKTSRSIHLVFAGVMAFAMIGLFVGMRQGKTVPNLEKTSLSPIAPRSNALPALSYAEYDRRTHGVNSQWQQRLANLKLPEGEPLHSATTLDDRRLVLERRSQRRAFDGAPPMVPHPIDQMSTSSCVACHGDGLAVGKGMHAPRMPHALLPNCTQCHVEQKATEFDAFVLADNFFEGKPPPESGSRAWLNAPPTIPHATHMREDCLSCHGQHSPLTIRTSHPWRTNCLQCHAPSASFDQVHRPLRFVEVDQP